MALGEWQTGDRISPAYGTTKQRAQDVSPGVKRTVFFIGPVEPSTITPRGNVLLTTGIYNFVMVVDSEQDIQGASQELALYPILPWERWDLDGTNVQTVTYSPAVVNTPGRSDNSCAPLPIEAPELKAAATEYRTLMASTIGKAKVYCRSVEEDLLRFDKNFRKFLESEDDHPVSKHGWLINVNAALSRFSSQTFAGTSPIMETECHFWSHSFLGVGAATLALTTIRRIVETAVLDASFCNILDEISDPPARQGRRLCSIPSDDAFWSSDHIDAAATAVQAKKSRGEAGDDTLLPLIVCFSGRDGFRSTQFSLSAPLEIITNCNTVSWTLLTLTHEISHVIIEAVLGKLLDINNVGAIERIYSLVIGETPPANFKELLSEYLCIAFMRMAGHEQMSPAIINNIILKHYAEADEILTHIFDFIYFYRKDNELYIRSVWASWAVIPNIRDRIPDYLIRTLCALLSRNMHIANKYDETFNILLDNLKSLQSEHPNAQYLQGAIDEMVKNKDGYIKTLKCREHFVKLVRFFLYSPAIAERFMKSIGPSSNSLTTLIFDGRSIGGPLRFLETVSRDKRPSETKSLWILYQLAFHKI
ncbi:MAG: hypothetical protein IV101_07940 [Dechloromonas sp.]|nr:hypothetical protein [Dechloromonas sp.]